MADLAIRRMTSRIIEGEIRIPAFQRKWVWTPQQVSFLLDSIYKGFPVGAIFLWKTNTRLENERKLGNFTLPEPRKEHPIYYVLDGQQRITALFSVFQTDLEPDADYEWLNIYFDFEAIDDLQESKFVALREEDVQQDRHFPVSCIMDASSFYQKTKDLDDVKQKIILELQQKFQEYAVPIHEFETDSKEEIAIVFERINRAGTPLNTFQLLSAWSWSADFDLQEKFMNLAAALEPFGFGNISEDQDLQMKCCSGIIKGDTTPATIMNLRGEEVRAHFKLIEQGIKGAVDFLVTQLNIKTLGWVPYPSMIVPLSVFFATERRSGLKYSDSQRRELLRWFWRSNFSRRYSNSIQEKHRQDIIFMRKLAKAKYKELTEIDSSVDVNFFLNTAFNVSTVNTKTFVLMLANNKPISFISGKKVSVGEVLTTVNRNEFHHFFPKKYLETIKVLQKDRNCLANFCMIDNADNQQIKDKSPSEYQKLIPKKIRKTILNRAFCPADSFSLDYKDFSEQRANLLVSEAHRLMS